MCIYIYIHTYTCKFSHSPITVSLLVLSAKGRKQGHMVQSGARGLSGGYTEDGGSKSSLTVVDFFTMYGSMWWIINGYTDIPFNQNHNNNGSIMDIQK